MVINLPGVLYGAAFYPEYLPEGRLDTDLDLMVEAGLTVIRVGESVWSTWEPRSGEFELEWLQPVLDGAHARGIHVVLGTPTYAVPPWLQVAHPEIALVTASGESFPWGSRQEIDYSSPTFRIYAERVIRAIIGRYAGHPAVIGYQVDNEPGLHLFHGQAVFEGFLAWLEKTYGTVDTLNREWGLTYWSHRLDEWSELWRPAGNSSPQYDLAWRRYQAELTTEFIAWQAGIVREYSSPEQFVTTCIAYARPGVDDREVVRALDVTAGNPYYSMQDHLDAGQVLEPDVPWFTTGVPGLLGQADRFYSSRQERFLVTETNAQAIGGSHFNQPPYPGQLKQAALALVSRGASMVEYWHWHTLHFGFETHWGGVLPHSLEPGRVFREVSEIGAELRAIGTSLTGYSPDADVALLWSNDSGYALDFMPTFPDAQGAPGRDSYEHIFHAHYRGVIDGGAQARILHSEQALESGAGVLAATHPVLVAAGLYVASDELLDLLRDYAHAGGHLIVGVRTGFGDGEARARTEQMPARLAAASGTHYDEVSNLRAPISLVPTSELPLSDGARAERWVDGLLADSAETLLGYDHPRFGDFAAATSRVHGAGRITVLGTSPSPALAADLIRWAVPEPIADRLTTSHELPLTVSSGVNGAGDRVWFVFNWGWREIEFPLTSSLRDAVTGTGLPAGTTIRLGPWSTRTFVDAADSSSTSHH
ncbi:MULTISPECIES: beta-galactosidase [unclassified Rathayibacter]|uniref:beta-galactosidase n=1 Tax=unclassified Rathayibacter TaxID=2609250 RepID=UPI001FB28211|nr:MULTISPECIES: beta-galactosidase [unclassified Rathayibacter]MCJ1674611.1 beta-galactosidase [Rathayibacter sp. VKM Ac-2929]MCJ1684891.1 beta-galactosidase [Rathayibacter sp. VKM Ac-2928]